MHTTCKNRRRTTPPLITLQVGPDGTCDRELRRLRNQAREAIGGGCRTLKIDVSRIWHMNCALIATVVLVVREAREAGGQVVLHGRSESFTKWMDICGVAPVLRAAGVAASCDRSDVAYCN